MNKVKKSQTWKNSSQEPDPCEFRVENFAKMENEMGSRYEDKEAIPDLISPRGHLYSHSLLYMSLNEY